MKYRKTKGYKYILCEDELLDLDIFEQAYNNYISLSLGSLTVREGYAWDGSSIPFKKYVPNRLHDFDKYCKTASLIHDALCQLMREGMLSKDHKQYADMLYRDMCIEERMKMWDSKAKAKVKAKAKTKDKAKAKAKAKAIKKRKKYAKKAKRWANLRYWALRKFGNAGIRKRKNPRDEIFEV